MFFTGSQMERFLKRLCASWFEVKWVSLDSQWDCFDAWHVIILCVIVCRLPRAVPLSFLSSSSIRWVWIHHPWISSVLYSIRLQLTCTSWDSECTHLLTAELTVYRQIIYQRKDRCKSRTVPWLQLSTSHLNMYELYELFSCWNCHLN